ncbi:MAG: M1 family metallopeptidase, partial [Rhodothalassiaceae bacterium]
MHRMFILAVVLLLAVPAFAQGTGSPAYGQNDPFRQLDELWPTPNVYRAGSGAPGHAYWQQEADYKIAAAIDDATQTLRGHETITYRNNSPDSLRYLWLQLDQNRFAKHSNAWATLTQLSKEKLAFSALRMLMLADEGKLGHHIASVKDAAGRNLPFTIVDTVMRIDLPQPLAPGKAVRFSIDWSYQIPEGKALSARGGWELFEKDGNYLYFIAQWFPRMVAYTDAQGWNTKAFLGRGEFTLEFGDYDVAITVPADFVVASTGELQNADAVLTEAQRQRLAEARTAQKPVFIVTPDEAKENQKEGTKETRTWHFRARRVRDFAFAASRKFIWDARGYEVEPGRTVMAMSFYPPEGMPLWHQYSTEAIVQALDVYSRMTVPYPYPVAISVNGPLGGGMEYPMITSNGPRPEEDGTYSRRTKYGLISVVIHEIGHSWFPMIVNSDERNWTWMDEGLNSFLQFLAEREWEKDYPRRRGYPSEIVDYMLSPNQVPIMTQSDSILQFGNNAYAKPATALNILRETVLGRDLFDFAFKEYARRWWFKRPMPADFFRTMEDASGVD